MAVSVPAPSTQPPRHDVVGRGQRLVGAAHGIEEVLAARL